MSDLTTLAFEIAARDAAWPMLPVVMVDVLTGELVYVSRCAAEEFGYPPEEIIGTAIELLVPDMQLRAGRVLRGRRKSGERFPMLVRITPTRILDRDVGVAVVMDLTGIV